MAKLTTPAPRPQPQRQSGYQPEQEKNRIESSISNRGKSAVDSIATPMAKYRKMVNDAIGSRWYYYIHDRMDLIAFGSVRISFVIDAKGHISGMRVDANSSNQSLADVSMRAVHDAEIGPPPSDPSSPISQAPLEWTLTFTYYPFSK
jgi:outer membrane biosynthesis protein TonB